MTRTSVSIVAVATVFLLLAATATAHFRMDLMDGYQPNTQVRRSGGGGGGGGGPFDFVNRIFGIGRSNLELEEAPGA